MSERLEGPLEAIPEIANLVVTFFGLYQIAETVYGQTHSYWIAGASMLLVLGIVAMPLVRWVRRPDLFKLYGLSVHERVVVVESQHAVSVCEDGTGSAEVRRNMLFLENPRHGDLRDIFELSEQLDLNDLVYESPDALEVSRRRISGQRVAIYWIPRALPGLTRLYQHSFRFTARTNFLDPGNYWELLVDMPIGAWRLDLRSRKPIVSALAFRGPRGFHFRERRTALPLRTYTSGD